MQKHETHLLESASDPKSAGMYNLGIQESQ